MSPADIEAGCRRNMVPSELIFVAPPFFKSSLRPLCRCIFGHKQIYNLSWWNLPSTIASFPSSFIKKKRRPKDSSVPLF